MSDQLLTEARAILRSALAADALDAIGLRNQSLRPGIAAIRPGVRLVGRVFPVRLDPVDEVPPVPYQGLLAAIDAVGTDDVIVAAAGYADRAAVWGELISTVCRYRGAVGVVTDGPTRDIEIVRDLDGFEVFARGAMPNDVNGRLEWGVHGEPVEIDGVIASRGDLIVADPDGVVIIPAAHAEEIVARVRAKASAESQFRTAVASGMSAADAFVKFGVL
jgi:4-hydroxy-4-methyl-2-oxoglutarate aldolase